MVFQSFIFKGLSQYYDTGKYDSIYESILASLILDFLHVLQTSSSCVFSDFRCNMMVQKVAGFWNWGHEIYQSYLCTPRKFNIAPKNRQSQKETHLPTIIFQGLAVKFRGSITWCWFRIHWCYWRVLALWAHHLFIPAISSISDWWNKSGEHQLRSVVYPISYEKNTLHGIFSISLVVVLYPILVTPFFFTFQVVIAGFHPSTVVLMTVHLKTVIMDIWGVYAR